MPSKTGDRRGAERRYEVEVISDDPQVQGTVHLIVTCSDQAPGCIPGSMGSAGGTGTGRCPSCFGEEFGGELCNAFTMTASLVDKDTYTFTWTPVEGAEYYVFSIVDGFGTLLADSAVVLEGVDSTSYTYAFRPEDLAGGRSRRLCAPGMPAKVTCVWLIRQSTPTARLLSAQGSAWASTPSPGRAYGRGPLERRTRCCRLPDSYLRC